jgi:hypothetical protein
LSMSPSTPTRRAMSTSSSTRSLEERRPFKVLTVVVSTTVRSALPMLWIRSTTLSGVPPPVGSKVFDPTLERYVKNLMSNDGA